MILCIQYTYKLHGVHCMVCLHGLMVSTLDYESKDCGSNPDGGDFFTISKLAASESTQLEMSTPVL